MRTDWQVLAVLWRDCGITLNDSTPDHRIEFA
jgi:hypothetical protein